MDEIIGFDLGQSEFSLAKTSAVADGPAEILPIGREPRQIAALALDVRAGVLVGERATDFDGAAELHVGLRRNPDDTRAWRRARGQIQSFVAEVYRQFVDTRQLSANGADGAALFVFGCPSKWSKSARAKYRRCLLAAGLPEVAVVAEARAALIHARDCGAIGQDELEASALVVDIGSKTTSLTHVCGLSEPLAVPVGARLGVGLIDEALLERAMASTRGESGATRSGFRFFPPSEAQCRHACRRAKESFLREHAGEGPGGIGSATLHADHAPERTFDVRVNAQVMDEVLAQPMARLGSRSWRDAYRRTLLRARRWLAARDREPKVVLLTGGASRMEFTVEVCREVFAEARVVRDPEPEQCIARGLAALGRWDLRTKQFMAAVGAFCDSDALKALVAARVPGLLRRATPTLIEAWFDAVLNPFVKDVRDGRVKVQGNLATLLAPYANKWSADPASVDRLRPAMAWLADRIRADLEDLTAPICERFRLPAQSLTIDLAPPADPLGGAFEVGTVFATMFGLFVSLEFGVADLLTPVWLRGMVPNFMIDSTLWTMKHAALMLDQSFPAGGSPFRKESWTDELADVVRMQIREQLLAVAAKARIHIQ